MRVIDARLLRETGIGRYVRNLVGAVLAIDGTREYAVLVPAGGLSPAIAAPNARVVVSTARAYSLAELVLLPVVVGRLRPSLLHELHYPVPLARRYPLVVTIHDLVHLRFPASPPKRLFARAMLATAARADAIVVPSQATRADVLERLGVNASRVHVIPEAVDPAITPVVRDEARAFARARGIAHDFLLFVGNPKAHKGLDVLLDAFAEIAPRRTDVDLVLVGPPLPRELVRRVGTSAIAGRVHRGGAVDDAELSLFYGAAVALVHPSRYEGFGLTVLEAMACGLPVVTTTAGALPEVAGGAALLVAPDDAPALAAAIDRVVESAELRRTLSAAGQRRAADFSWRATASATLAIYDTVERG